MRTIRTVIAGLTVAAIVIACEASGPTAPAASRSPVTTTPPRTTAPTLSPRDLQQAVRFREAFGLRRDHDWVLEVSFDPSSSHDFGVALTADEVRELARRANAADTLPSVMVAYGELQPGWAGTSIDQRRAGLVVAHFAEDADVHRDRLEQLLPAEGWDVVGVEHSLDRLRAVEQSILADEAWFATIDAKLVSLGVDVAQNRVTVSISSANPLATAAVIDRFAGENVLRVESDGTGAALLPSGHLTLVAVTPDGRPIPRLSILFESGIRGVGVGDVGFGMSPERPRLDLDLAAVTWRIDAHTRHGDRRRLVGSTLVTVPPDDRVTAEIVVEASS